MGSSSTTIHLYSVQVTDKQFGPDGKEITDPNAAPAAGDYFIDTANDYLGDHTTHGSAAVATDHIDCMFTTVRANSGTALCNGQIEADGSMMYADNQTVSFDSSTSAVTLKITGGTGRFAGASGTVASNDVGNTNNSDDTITVSASGQGSAPTGTSPTLSSSAQTLNYYSKSVTEDQFGPDGKAMTDPNAAPEVGGYFVSTDQDYVGNHSQHDSATAGTDHLVCVILSITGDTANVRCDGQIAIGNSMFLADHQLVQVSQSTGNVSLSITGGTGSLEGATGKLATTDVPNSNDSDFALSVSK